MVVFLFEFSTSFVFVLCAGEYQLVCNKLLVIRLLHLSHYTHFLHTIALTPVPPSSSLVASCIFSSCSRHGLHERDSHPDSDITHYASCHAWTRGSLANWCIPRQPTPQSRNSKLFPFWNRDIDTHPTGWFRVGFAYSNRQRLSACQPSG